MDSAATSHRARRRAGLSTSLCALLASLLLCVGTFMLVRPCYPLADDYVQQLYVSGRLLGCGACGLMPYTLWPISAPMSALYQVLPAVPWYAITLLALTTVSFWACGTQALRTRLSAPAKACVCMALGALEVISTMYFTYTVVAFLATSAGLATLVARSSFGREGLGVPDACALALVCLGFALRPESGLGALAVFSPFAVYVIAHNRHAAPICRGVVTVLATLAVMAAGGLAYDATPGWESYGDYLGHGRDALDYPELTADEMREIDPSITDASASILNKWIFIQSDPFDVEFFERLGSSRAHVSRAYLLDALKAKTTWLALGLIALFGVAGAAMMRNIHASSAARALAMGVCVMALASCLSWQPGHACGCTWCYRWRWPLSWRSSPVARHRRPSAARTAPTARPASQGLGAACAVSRFPRSWACAAWEPRLACGSRPFVPQASRARAPSRRTTSATCARRTTW